MATDGAGEAFEALGDATRRALVEALASGPLPVGELARRVPVSRPAVSQHLRVLREAGLVEEEVAGTRRIHRLRPEGVAALRDQLDALWRDALDHYARLVEDGPTPTEESS